MKHLHCLLFSCERNYNAKIKRCQEVRCVSRGVFRFLRATHHVIAPHHFCLYYLTVGNKHKAIQLFNSLVQFGQRVALSGMPE